MSTVTAKNIKKETNKKNIVSFSGGKDSTYMLLKLVENKVKIDEIIFCDTGMEFPGMYDHINKVKNFINKDVTVLRSQKTYKYYLGEHEKTKGKNKGKIGYGHPDFRNRWCTNMLKKQPFKKYIKEKYNYNITNFIAIALDEKERTLKNKDNKWSTEYPLIDWKITEKEALEYCYEVGFDWNGLYKDFSRVSCWCCPLSSINELQVLYNKYPELWTELLNMDKYSFRTFRSDYSLEQLTNRFEKEKQKININLLF